MSAVVADPGMRTKTQLQKDVRRILLAAEHRPARAWMSGWSKSKAAGLKPGFIIEPVAGEKAVRVRHRPYGKFAFELEGTERFHARYAATLERAGFTVENPPVNWPTREQVVPAHTWVTVRYGASLDLTTVDARIAELRRTYRLWGSYEGAEYDRKLLRELGVKP